MLLRPCDGVLRLMPSLNGDTEGGFHIHIYAFFFGDLSGELEKLFDRTEPLAQCKNVL